MCPALVFGDTESSGRRVTRRLVRTYLRRATGVAMGETGFGRTRNRLIEVRRTNTDQIASQVDLRVRKSSLRPVTRRAPRRSSRVEEVAGSSHHVSHSPNLAMPHDARPTAAPQTRQGGPFPLVRGFCLHLSQRGGHGFKSRQLHRFRLVLVEKMPHPSRARVGLFRQFAPHAAPHMCHSIRRRSTSLPQRCSRWCRAARACLIA
jgi:hypothetical protein